jgi:hypothetical protein
MKRVPLGTDQENSVACHHHVAEALRLSAELLELADEQREGCDHDGCLLLDGMMRDCAWKIRQAALQWRLDLGESRIVERLK